MSLSEKPAILTTHMSLTPIYRIVRLVDKKKAKGCREALEDIVGKISDNQGKFLIFFWRIYEVILVPDK